MPLIEFITDEIRLWTILHMLGVVVGLGAATVTDVLFFRFLKDFRISKKEADIMATLSKVIWLALIVLVVSGIALFIPKQDVLLANGKFLTKTIALGVIIINGLMLNFYLQPRLITIHFAGERPVRERLARKIAFLLGGISVSSWYFVFIIGSLRGVRIPFSEVFLVYLILLFVAVSGSQLYEYRLWKKYKKAPLPDGK